jgi:hypothetical protein
MAFRPGQKLVHKATGTRYTFVKTLCLTPQECFCVMRKNGKDTECLIYPNEVELVA